MNIKITLVFTLIISALNSWAQIPNMPITFGGRLQNDCQFVDNSDVISALDSALRTLNQIEQVQAECQSLITNSKAYIQSYLDYSLNSSTQLITAQANERTILDLISKKELANNYQGQFDLELLAVKKDIAKLSEKQVIKQQTLAQTLNLGSQVFESLRTAPAICNQSFGADVLAPSINIIGNMGNYIGGGTNPLIAIGASFLANVISYVDRITSSSYKSFKKLTQSSNYFNSYKCAFKNIEGIICNLEEEEAITYSEADLAAFAQDILALDTPKKEFKELRDLQRHRYRISSLIEKLERIYSSPETINDTQTVNEFGTKLARLELIPRLAPLKNSEYLNQLQVAINNGRILNAPPVDFSRAWTTWDKNEAVWRDWFYSNFYPGNDYLSQRVDYYCSTLDQNPLFPNIYNPASLTLEKCNAANLDDVALINEFVKIVIAPSLVDLQAEISRINSKIQTNANLNNLFQEVRSQETDLGNADYSEYTLTTLIDMNLNHVKRHGQLNSPAHFYAQDYKRILLALKELTVPQHKFKDFEVKAREAYSIIAGVSINSEDPGVTLFRSFIETKITSYFEVISNSFLYNQDRELAKNFVKFNSLGDLYRSFIRRFRTRDSQGSSNIPQMVDIREQFLDVFGAVIKRKFSETIDKYKTINAESYDRELLHSCTIFYPFLTKDSIKDSGNKMKDFCENLLKKENGLSILNNSPKKFPLTLEDGSTYKNRCYYNNYEQNVTEAIIYDNREIGRVRF